MIESEAALFERVRRGDAEAFERLFLRHYAQVYRVLYNLVGSREEAEDLAQDQKLFRIIDEVVGKFPHNRVNRRGLEVGAASERGG